MHRTVHAHLHLPQETARKLDRPRRGSHHPLARFINAVFADYLDDACATRPPGLLHPSRRRAA